MSAPSASGCWRYGVAKVLSTTTRPSRPWASAAIAAMSTTVRVGLVGVSIHTMRVSSRHAASSAAWSVRSTALQAMPARREHLRHQPERAAVHVVTDDHVVAGRQEPQHRVGGRHAAGERPAQRGPLERRQADLERLPRRVPAARVLVATGATDRSGGTWSTTRWGDHRAGHRVGRLPGVDRPRLEAVGPPRRLLAHAGARAARKLSTS